MTQYIRNGDLVTEGHVSLSDRGYTLGDGLFETVPLYYGVPFALDYHYERLLAGAHKIRVDLPFKQIDIKSAVLRLAERNEVSRGVARLTVTRGVGPRGYGIAGCDHPEWTLTCADYEPAPMAEWEKGITLHPVSIRKDPGSPLRSLKAVSSLEAVMILDEAKEHGADEALTLTTESHISSCAAMNIFWVSKGKLFTPSVECAILPGVTRRIIIELAHQTGMSVVEGRFKLPALIDAEEIFVTNSLLEVAPVTHITGIYQSDRPGAITLVLAEKYSELTVA